MWKEAVAHYSEVLPRYFPSGHRTHYNDGLWGGGVVTACSDVLEELKTSTGCHRNYGGIMFL
jgi:hypothetical protein